MTITRTQFARSLGWIGVVAFLGICFLDQRLHDWQYGWLAYPGIPVTIFLTVLAIKHWGGEEALKQTEKGVIEAFVSFATSGITLALLLFVGVLIFVFGLSVWSLIRS
jgi:hypothetical protein